MVDCYRWLHEDLPRSLGYPSKDIRLIVAGWSAGATTACYMAHHGPARTGLPSPAAVIVTYGTFEHGKMYNAGPDAIFAALPEDKRAFAMKVFDEPPKAGVRHP